MKKSKTWAWDIEAVEWDRPRCVVARSSDGDVERFAGPGCLASLVEVAERAGGTWVAHAGGIYDTLLYSQTRGKPWSEIIMSGSAVLAAHEGRHLVLRDSFRWWLSGLAKVGRYLDELEQRRVEPRHPPGHWRKRDVDRTRIEALTDDEVLAYCESDVAILLEGIHAARSYHAERGARPAWTAGACALSLLQALEPITWRALKRHALRSTVAIPAGECVRGARVEAWARGEVPRVYVYDWSSAYPASYATEPIGIGARRLAPGDPDRPGSVWRCRWFWPWRDRIPPATDATTGAGAGWCEAWLVEEERACFEEVEIPLQYCEGWAPACLFPVGQIFAHDLYHEKSQGSFFAKVYLNALHGKFSESPIKTTWTRERPREWYGPEPQLVGPYWRALKLDVEGDGTCRPHLQPLAAASILGRQRARLWRAIREVVDAGGQVYYCDTDSIHTDLPPERMPVPLGTGLGSLVYEGGPFAAIYLGPKAYVLRHHTSGAIKGACKGMPWGALADGVVRRGCTRAPRYRQARGSEEGRDLRWEVFERALHEPVEIVKEGIASWAQGLRSRAGWARVDLPRTLQPQDGAKRWGESPTAWAYQTPAEVLRGRWDPVPDFDTTPWDTPEAPHDFWS